MKTLNLYLPVIFGCILGQVAFGETSLVRIVLACIVVTAVAWTVRQVVRRDG